MESALKKLEAQEAKYSAELDAALKEYSELKKQASEFDAGELMEARLSIRGEKNALRLLVCRTPMARNTIR